LGGQPCPGDSEFTCVTVPMPLDHFNPADPRTLDVTFAVLPAAGSRKGLFVTATGGPGTSGISLADSYTAAFDQRIPRRFDIVFFDQRGMGLSGGLACPEAAAIYYQTDTRADTPEQEAALVQAARTFSESCASEAGRLELLPYLGTAQAVQDLERFRELLQAEALWLYGESYGTQFAQTYAAAHPSRLAGLILDGTVDLTLTGFDFYAQQAQAFSDTLTATLDGCTADPACRADMRRAAAAVYDQLATRLDRGPVAFQYPLPSGAYASRTFTFADLEVVASSQMYTEDDRLLFNRALAAYGANQDLVPLARLLYIDLGLDPETLAVIPDPTWSEAIYYGVECQDYAYPGATPAERAENYLRQGDAVEAAIPRLGTLFYGDLPCAFWPNAAADRTRPAPPRADGIPVLVLGATADPATPVGNGRSVYAALADGYLITQQGGPHVIFGRGNACPDDLVTAFLLRGRVPAQRETECPGLVVSDYVPLAPARADAFVDLAEAFGSVETEINYLPEYYYWDGLERVAVGCPHGGTLGLEPNGGSYAFTLDTCAFTRGFTLTGAGSYNPDRDRFVLDVASAGRWDCANLRFVRAGDRTRVTGDCGGQRINLP
jgi:pimeloyl-ACP methyl ester carboxylesterase